MTTNNSKILNLDELKKKIHFLKKNKKKIVHCHGVFDLIHVGHIKHFYAAKKNGDFLLVSLTADKFVNKGIGKPLFNQDLRAEVISSLEKVDAVYINDSSTSINLINTIKPNIYFKGPDYKNLKKDKTGNIKKEINAVRKNRGKILFSDDIKFSSSKIINSNYEIFNADQKKFLNSIKYKYNYDFIVKKIEEMQKHKIFLIGEIIIDRYIFGDVLGKSGKEPHLVIKKNKEEQYLGGSGAIANHLSSFVNKITLLSTLGNEKDLTNFIKASLKKNISHKFFKIDNSSTVLKSRFIDSITGNKLLGVYNLDNQILKKKIEKKIHKYIETYSNKNDLILISDYGHGMISSTTAKKLVQQKNFLCLNAQVNASNIGYHSLRKYKKINTLVINENELRHEMRDKLNKIEKLSQKLSIIYNIKNLIITRGKMGAILLYNKKEFHYCPAFANKILDKVGAGDAMLALISLSLRVNMPQDLALFIGSLAGATAVENIGNSKFINKNELLRQIEYLIK